MGSQVGLWRTTLVAFVPVVAIASLASAEPLTRDNWVPNNGLLGDGVPLGDLWTFRCPRGGTVSVSVNTKDDADSDDQPQSHIDPILRIVDGAGTPLAFADDNVECAFPPVCGFACPSVTEVPCGGGGRHRIIVRDLGVDDSGVGGCTGGGGYVLTVEVFAPDGSQLSDRQVELGGGPRREVQPPGPALDDEGVRITVGSSSSPEALLQEESGLAKKEKE